MPRMICSRLMLVLALMGLAVLLAQGVARSQSQPAEDSTGDEVVGEHQVVHATLDMEAMKRAQVSNVPTTSSTEQLIKGDPDKPYIGLFYSGRRGSTIEPCGCQTKQRGGLQYEARIYELHARHPHVRVDAGDWTRARIETAPVYALQTRYLLRAFEPLRLDAVNVGINDVQFSSAFYETMQAEYPGVLEPLISANIFKAAAPDEHYFPAYRIVTRLRADGTEIRIGIAGATTTLHSPRGGQETTVTEGDFILKPATEALKPVLAELESKADLLMLLYHGHSTSLIPLLEAYPDLDVVVTTGPLPDARSRAQLYGGTLLLSVPNYQGKEIGQIALQETETGGWESVALPVAHAVSVDLAPKPELVSLIAEFKEQTEAMEVPLPSRGVEETFAGAARCRDCHGPIYEDWKNTLHSHALETLINVGQQFNPSCLECHTTGYQEANGFYSTKHQPSLNFKDVQCEVCHGPSLKHTTLENQLKYGRAWKSEEEYNYLLDQAKANIPPATVAEDVCVQCHVGDNDPDFNFREMNPHINHSLVPEAQRASPARPEPTFRTAEVEQRANQLKAARDARAAEGSEQANP